MSKIESHKILVVALSYWRLSVSEIMSINLNILSTISPYQLKSYLFSLCKRAVHASRIAVYIKFPRYFSYPIGSNIISCISHLKFYFRALAIQLFII